MDEKAIKAIESILEKGDRVELIPGKDHIKVVKVRRGTVETVPKHREKHI